MERADLLRTIENLQAQISAVHDECEGIDLCPDGTPEETKFVAQAAALNYKHGKLEKLHKKLADAGKDYVIANTDPGFKSLVGRVSVNHFTAKRFDDAFFRVYITKPVATEEQRAAAEALAQYEAVKAAAVESEEFHQWSDRLSVTIPKAKAIDPAALATQNERLMA